MSTARDHLRALPSPVKDPAGRPPPQDLDAERALLEYVTSCGGIDEIRDILQPEDFFGVEEKYTAGICWDLADRGVRLDSVTVMHEIRERGLDKRVPAEWLGAHVFDACPAVANPREYARLVAQLSRSRRFIALCQYIAAEGYGDVGDRDEWILRSIRDVAAMAESLPREDAVSIEHSVQIAMGKIWDAIEHRGQLLGLSTGLANLDEQTAGLHAGDMTLLTAPTKGGKTALACQLAITVAEQGRGVVFFSLEMPHDQLSTRMCCSQARVNWHAIRLGKQIESDYSALISASERIKALPLSINRHRGMKVRELMGQTQRSRSDFEADGTPLGLVVIDYLQQVDGRDEIERKQYTRERELANVAKLVVGLAEDCNVPVVALAQTNEEGQVRECRAILHEATGWWDLQVDKEAKPPRPAEIRIPVQRHGPSGVSATCWFHPAYLIFSDEEHLPL